MSGFKNFLLRGNLIELAVAFIMATAFAKVVTEFTNLVMSLIGKVGGNPDFSTVTVGGVNVGLFINALVAFVIIAAVVYFFIVVPYTHAKEKFFPAEAAGPSEVELLIEIRDALATRA
jgi:large conductance mechanosensitive channel